MKSKNPKFIKKSLCVAIVLITIVVTASYVIGSYKSNKLAIAKAKGEEGLATVELTTTTGTYTYNTDVDIVNKSDYKYVKVLKKSAYTNARLHYYR